MNNVEARQALDLFKIIKNVSTGTKYVKVIAGFKGGSGMQVLPNDGEMKMYDYKTYDLPVGTYIDASVTDTPTNPQTSVCNLLDHFGIDWHGLSSATIQVSGIDNGIVIIKTTREINTDDKPIEFDHKTYKITEL